MHANNSASLSTHSQSSYYLDSNFPHQEEPSQILASPQTVASSTTSSRPVISLSTNVSRLCDQSSSSVFTRSSPHPTSPASPTVVPPWSMANMPIEMSPSSRSSSPHSINQDRHIFNYAICSICQTQECLETHVSSSTPLSPQTSHSSFLDLPNQSDIASQMDIDVTDLPMESCSRFSPPSTPTSPKMPLRPLKKVHKNTVPTTDPESWRNVCENIKRMDSLYDATFYTWLKSEENVVVTSVYLHRIANQYPLARIINALKWLICDWRLESIGILVKHITTHWSGEQGDIRRATLLQHLTHNWAPQYIASLIASVLSSPPYTPYAANGKPALQTTVFISEGEKKGCNSKERFLRQLVCDYDFSKLSEFLIQLSQPTTIATGGPTMAFQKQPCTHDFSQASYLSHNITATTTIVIDYKIKVAMLKEAATREKELPMKVNAKTRGFKSLKELEKECNLDVCSEGLGGVIPTTGPRRHPATPQPNSHRHVVVQHPSQLHQHHPGLHHRSSQHLFPQRAITTSATNMSSSMVVVSETSSTSSNVSSSHTTPEVVSTELKRPRMEEHESEVSQGSRDDGHHHHSASPHMRRRSSIRRRRNSFSGGMEIDKMEVEASSTAGPSSADETADSEVTQVKVDMDMGVASVATNGNKGKETENGVSPNVMEGLL